FKVHLPASQGSRVGDGYLVLVGCKYC
uniref:Uncharacterized protein LOC104243569 n=1 Tax=Nicotiana sylvestris TaxID=4096 RepID=A0A1U7YCV9_NICSY